MDIVAQAQYETKNVKIKSIMHCGPFVIGFNEVREGVPFGYDKFITYDKHLTGCPQWSYERGRMFACIYKGPLKNGKKLTYDAQVAFGDGMTNGDII
jgi:hypothetical protein